MHVKNLSRMLALTLIFLGLTACNLGTVPPETSSLPTETLAAPETAAQGLCANPLFPVKVGVTWTYTNSGGPAGTFSFTDTVTDIRADGFTLTSQFTDLTRTQEWACNPDGLLALTLGAAGSAAGLSTPGMNAEFTTSNVTGITIPANVQPGMEWPYNLNLEGKLNMADGQSAQGEGTVSAAMKAIGTENVAVPAGTFDAMKIEATSTFNITATYQGFSVPLTFTVNATLWFAPGVGWVKSEESGEFAGVSYSSSTELQSYSIP